MANENADEQVHWLAAQCRELVTRARYETDDGAVLYYPAAEGDSYPRFYLRDFTYMYASAPELFPDDEVRPVVQMVLDNVRDDGWAPEKIETDGHALYRCHGNGDVVDSGPFCIQLVKAFVEATGDTELVPANLEKFWRMLVVLPHHDDTGLIWIEPDNPHTAYGFSDTIAKTGQELFCSLLVFEALGILRDWASAAGNSDVAQDCDAWGAKIRDSLPLLWSEEVGMFFAASIDCRQIDIWGSIYACRVGAVSDAVSETIMNWLATNRDKFEFRSHLRHLPQPEFWQRMTPPFDVPDEMFYPGAFQNGPYWSTPSGWYAELLEARAPGAGLQFLCELVETFRELGVWECIDPDGYRRIPDNLSSALLPYAALKRIRNAGRS